MSPFHGITREMFLPLFLRCFLGNVGFLMLTYSFKILPLSIGTVIIATSPFAVAIMSHIFLNEAISRIDINAIFVSFVGIIILAFGGQNKDNHNNVSAAEYMLALLTSLGAMMAVATVAITARYMKSIDFAVI
jgi:drug/metabolite transporter (DMT)-like permease